jgi:hypothetical protein
MSSQTEVRVLDAVPEPDEDDDLPMIDEATGLPYIVLLDRMFQQAAVQAAQAEVHQKMQVALLKKEGLAGLDDSPAGIELVDYDQTAEEPGPGKRIDYLS